MNAVDYSRIRIGDRLVLDRETAVIVTRTSVYVNNRQARETGVSVRPVTGGRSHPVSVSRLSYGVRS